MNIIAASTWGRVVRADAPLMRPAQITEMTVHYTGAKNVNRSQDQIASYIKAIERSQTNKDPNLSAISYNFAIDKFGRIWELRGWTYRNAANGTSSNSTSFSVVFLVGVEDNQPTPDMIKAVQWLYSEGVRRFKNQLVVKGHQQHKATACPGGALQKLVNSGDIQRGSTSLPTPAPRPPAPPTAPLPAPQRPVIPTPVTTVGPSRPEVPSTYTVVSGDSWWRIAEKTLGKGARWREIFTLNGSPRTLRPGQVLRLPGSLYTVIQGDTYWNLAVRFLGQGSRWQEISRLNGNAPLTPGRVIKLPERS